ncbi:MAG: cytoplasmic protein [Clostridia bacterium]|nr:DsrE family protein [Eubacteriales bacterium]MDD3866444.1 DsrE family protein [Eubacteriales bacterium]MDD4462489.1 DsrE family protein [Eubacteriales bacterium]NCC48419.1 cytoplasmic protein [Clostridia bacterium]
MKVAIFAFRGDPLCFIHVMLNALDLKARGHDVKVILEGEAVRLIREMDEAENPLFARLRNESLIACVCKACSAKMGVLEYNTTSGIPLADEMNGHPAMSTWLEQGYQIITQ